MIGALLLGALLLLCAASLLAVELDNYRRIHRHEQQSGSIRV